MPARSALAIGPVLLAARLTGKTDEYALSARIILFLPQIMANFGRISLEGAAKCPTPPLAV
jgi:hypothetical protein